LLKGNRRNHKEINRCNPFHVIAKEGLPGLQWPILPRHHIDRNRGLGDLDAQFEQFPVDLGSAPQRVLKELRLGAPQLKRERSPLANFGPAGGSYHDISNT
jgi:hypothetical protein